MNLGGSGWRESTISGKGCKGRVKFLYCNWESTFNTPSTLALEYFTTLSRKKEPFPVNLPHLQVILYIYHLICKLILNFPLVAYFSLHMLCPLLRTIPHAGGKQLWQWGEANLGKMSNSVFVLCSAENALFVFSFSPLCSKVSEGKISKTFLRGTDLIFIYALTYITHEVKNYCRDCTGAESPDTCQVSRMPGKKMPGKWSCGSSLGRWKQLLSPSPFSPLWSLFYPTVVRTISFINKWFLGICCFLGIIFTREIYQKEFSLTPLTVGQDNSSPCLSSCCESARLIQIFSLAKWAAA